MIHAESAEQRLFVARFRMDPRTRELPACAIPNAGRRSKATAGIMKAEGLSAGAPDWILFTPSAPRWPENRSERVSMAGLALEFKSPVGRVKITESQLTWHNKLRVVGWRVEVVQTAADAWRILCEYLDIEFHL